MNTERSLGLELGFNPLVEALCPDIYRLLQELLSSTYPILLVH